MLRPKVFYLSIAQTHRGVNGRLDIKLKTGHGAHEHIHFPEDALWPIGQKQKSKDWPDFLSKPDPAPMMPQKRLFQPSYMGHFEEGCTFPVTAFMFPPNNELAVAKLRMQQSQQFYLDGWQLNAVAKAGRKDRGEEHGVLDYSLWAIAVLFAIVSALLVLAHYASQPPA